MKLAFLYIVAAGIIYVCACAVARDAMDHGALSVPVIFDKAAILGR